jgi:hypothetical protein
VTHWGCSHADLPDGPGALSDGNTGTIWKDLYERDTKGDTTWVTRDLGSPGTVDKCFIHWESNYHPTPHLGWGAVFTSPDGISWHQRSAWNSELTTPTPMPAPDGANISTFTWATPIPDVRFLRLEFRYADEDSTPPPTEGAAKIAEFVVTPTPQQ